MSDNKSTVPVIAPPRFEATIPEYMINGIENETDKYIIEQLSIMSQQSAWQTHKIMNIYDYTRSINGKVVELEKFRNELLQQMKIEQEIDKKEVVYKKHYKVATAAFLMMLYPLYLTVVSQTGLVEIIKKLIFVMPM